MNLIELLEFLEYQANVGKNNPAGYNEAQKRDCAFFMNGQAHAFSYLRRLLEMQTGQTFRYLLVEGHDIHPLWMEIDHEQR